MRPSAPNAIDKIAIIGGGLAGLVAARRLHQAGIPFELIEARDRLGGRILSAGISGAPSSDGFDLGPSWFWPEMQPGLAALSDELGLAFFRQHDEGDVVVQYRAGAAPERYPGNGFQQSGSARLVGGTGAIVSALAAQLPTACIRMGTTVRSLIQAEGRVDLLCTKELGDTMRLEASRVILALPPRLLAEAIILEPPIEGPIELSWRQTPTWMAPHAKFFAVYDRPFWREEGLSGAGRSMVGPLAEIHDATAASGQAALFGFVGVPARQRSELGEAAIVRAAVEQLAEMFGSQAGVPKATLYKDWAADPLTATQDDLSGTGHPAGFRSPRVEGAWEGRLLLAGSEVSRREPGYLAGAVDAAECAVQELIRLSGGTVRGPAAAEVGR